MPPVETPQAATPGKPKAPCLSPAQEKKLGDLTDKIRDAEDRADRVKEHRKAKQDELDALQKTGEPAENRVSGLKRDIRINSETISGLEHQVRVYKHESNNITGRLAKEDWVWNQLEAESDDDKSYIESLGAMIASRSEECN